MPKVRKVKSRRNQGARAVVTFYEVINGKEHIVDAKQCVNGQHVDLPKGYRFKDIKKHSNMTKNSLVVDLGNSKKTTAQRFEVEPIIKDVSLTSENESIIKRTRTIHFSGLYGKSKKQDVTQIVMWYKDAKKNLATGKIVYGPEYKLQNDRAVWPALTLDLEKDGYKTPKSCEINGKKKHCWFGKLKLDEVEVTRHTEDVNVEVKYVGNLLSMPYVMMDGKKQFTDGTVTGYLGSIIRVVKPDEKPETEYSNIFLPKGYQLVGDLNDKLTFATTEPAKLVLEVKHEVRDLTNAEIKKFKPVVSKTVTKTVHYQVPKIAVNRLDLKEDQLIAKQSVRIARTVKFDEALNQLVYGPWDQANFKQEKILQVPGYKAVVQKPDGNDITVEYRPLDVKQVLKFVDAQKRFVEQHNLKGFEDWKFATKELGIQEVFGTTDEFKGFESKDLKLPEGFQLVKPLNIHFLPKAKEIYVPLIHTITKQTRTVAMIMEVDYHVDSMDTDVKRRASELDLKPQYQVMLAQKSVVVDKNSGKKLFDTSWSGSVWKTINPEFLGFVTRPAVINGIDINNDKAQEMLDMQYQKLSDGKDVEKLPNVKPFIGRILNVNEIEEFKSLLAKYKLPVADLTVKVDLVPEKYQQNVLFVDADTEEVIKSTNLSGVYGQRVDYDKLVNDMMPENWQLAKSVKQNAQLLDLDWDYKQEVELSDDMTVYKFFIKNMKPLRIKINHQIKQVHDSSLTQKVVTLSVAVSGRQTSLDTDIDYYEEPTEYLDTVAFVRNVKHDLVTDEIIKGPWEFASDKHAFASQVLKSAGRGFHYVDRYDGHDLTNDLKKLIDQELTAQSADYSFENVLIKPDVLTLKIKFMDRKLRKSILEDEVTSSINQVVDLKPVVDKLSKLGWKPVEKLTDYDYRFVSDDPKDLLIDVKHRLEMMPTDSKFYRIVTRMFEIHNLDGTITFVPQEALIGYKVKRDLVSKEFVPGDPIKDDSVAQEMQAHGQFLTGKWPEERVVELPAGYKIKEAGRVDSAMNAKEIMQFDEKDQHILVEFEPLDSFMTIQFQDIDNSDKKLEPLQLTGKTDQVVKLSDMKLPEGYELADNKVDSFRFGPSTQTYIVALKETVKDLTKVRKDLSEQIIKRTFAFDTSELPKGLTEYQNLDFTDQTSVNRTVGQNLVTDKLIFGNWTKSKLNHRLVFPPVPYGFHIEVFKTNEPDLKTGETFDPLTVKPIEVGYQSEDLKTVLKFVPDDVNFKLIVKDARRHTLFEKSFDGHFNETITPLAVLKSSKDAQQLLTKYELTGDKLSDPFKLDLKQDFIFDAKPIIEDVSASDPKAKRIIKRQLKLNVPAGVTLPDNLQVDQHAVLTRSAMLNLATGQTKYGQWSQGEFEEMSVPKLPGLVADYETIGKEVVTADTTDQTVEINYQPMIKQGKLELVDINDKHVVSSIVLKGQVGTHDEFDLKIDPRYKLINAKLAHIVVSYEEHGIFVNSQQLDLATSKIYLDHKVQDVTAELLNNPAKKNLVQRELVRTINILGLPKQQDPIVQREVTNRKAVKDLVSETITYSKWEPVSFKSLKLDQKTGYRIEESGSIETENNYSAVRAIYVKDINEFIEHEPLTVNVLYVPLDVTITINYVDTNTQRTVETHTMGGRFGDYAIAQLKVPEHYELTSNQQVAVEEFQQANNSDQLAVQTIIRNLKPVITVDLKHQIKEIKNPVEIHRTVKLNLPKQHQFSQDELTAFKPVDQIVRFFRIDEKDLVTGHVERNVEVKVDEDTGSTFPKVDIPVIAGYRPSIKVNEKAVTINNDDIHLVVNYIPEQQTQVVELLDENGKLIKKMQLTGITDEVRELTINIPDGWELQKESNDDEDK